MEIIGWMIWVFVAFQAVSFAFGARRYAKVRAPFQNATAVQTFFLWVLSVAFLVSDWNKLHLLWAVPVAFFGAKMIGLGAIPIVSPLVLIVTRVFIEIILIGVRVPTKEI